MSSKEQYLKEDTYDQKIQDFQSFTYLLKYVYPYKWQFIGAFSLLLMSSLLAIFSSRIMGELVEYGLIAKNWDQSVDLAAIILCLETFAIVTVWIGRKILAKAATDSIFLIRKAIFNHIHELPLSYYDRQPQGRTITRMTHDVEGMENFFSQSLGRILHSIITFVMAIFAMLVTHFVLGSWLVLAIVPAFVFTYLNRDRIRDVSREMSKRSSACNSKLAEYINGLPVIRCFGLENWAQDNYHEIVNQHKNSQLAANSFFCWSRPLTNFLCHFPLIGLIWWGGTGVLEGTLSVGVFVAFVRYCERFSYPLDALTREIQVVQQAFTSAERVTAFLNAKTESEELGQNGPFRPHAIKGQITFKNVQMSYDTGKVVLQDVNFEIQPGEKIGLAGTTGSGKTTTVSLLARLYEFQEGEIYIDEIPIRQYDRNFLRNQIGFVSQDVVIFKGTLRDNLTCEAIVQDEIINEACQLTGLAKLMIDNQLNLESEILDAGANLSVGERQLISLTRVLLSDPRILILDEATANVDPEFEKIIHQAVEKVMHGRTCLMIAHRLDTLKSCHRIFVFQGGKLIEQGNHRQLLKSKGHFYQLQKQAKTDPRSLVDA